MMSNIEGTVGLEAGNDSIQRIVSGMIESMQ